MNWILTKCLEWIFFGKFVIQFFVGGFVSALVGNLVEYFVGRFVDA